MSGSIPQRANPGKGWAVSMSAPAFSPAQEQEERDNLSPEETKEIEDELHGIQVFDFDVYEKSPEKMKEILERFHAAIGELPAIKTAAYHQALEVCPDIVEKETNPVMFLRCEHYDVPAAARRMATHWKERKDLFGEDRAFLPMTLSGAMNDKDDQHQLEMGYCVRVPNDRWGRPVLYLDRASYAKHPEFVRDGWLRSFWYLVQVICNEDEYQKSGYVIIINLKDYDPHKCGDRLGAKKMFLYVRECWCPRFKGYHATYGSRQTPVKIVEPAIRKMQGPHIRLHLRNHYGFDSDNLKAMSEYGIEEKHVSAVIGGTFTNEDNLEWIRKQRAREEEQQRE